jgi:hypothetical protein
MTNYKINVDVLRWKQGEIISELELKSEGVDISKWLNENLLVIPEVLKKVEDLNKDGKVDKEDGKLASKVLNVLKGNSIKIKNKKRGR